MRVGVDAPPPRDLQPFAGRQAGPDAEEWRNRLGSDPDATPDDDLAQLDALGVERIVRPDQESVRLAFPDGSDSVIDMGSGAVQPVGQRARSPSPRAELPERQTNELIKSDGIEGDGGDKLPFRFADGGAIAAAEDPARAVPGVYLNPAANRELIGEYGRLWQSQAGHQQAGELRAEGKPVQASLQNLAADEWLRSTEPGPANAAARPGRTNPRLTSALSNLVSLEGEAQHHVEDWLANLQRDSQDKRAEHYRVADELLARGQTEPAALHQHIADRWADPTQGVEREVLEPALTDQGWQVVSLDDNREFSTSTSTVSATRSPDDSSPGAASIPTIWPPCIVWSRNGTAPTHTWRSTPTPAGASRAATPSPSLMGRYTGPLTHRIWPRRSRSPTSTSPRRAGRHRISGSTRSDNGHGTSGDG